MLEYILSHDGCDVDPTNKLEGATPLHLAVKLEEPEARVYFVRELLDAGADYTFVRLIPHFSAIATVKTCGLDTGYGIRMVKRHRTS